MEMRSESSGSSLAAREPSQPQSYCDLTGELSALTLCKREVSLFGSPLSYSVRSYYRMLILQQHNLINDRVFLRPSRGKGFLRCILSSSSSLSPSSAA